MAIAAVAVAVAVALTFRRSPTPRGVAQVAPADPKALVESASGRIVRVNREQEEIRIEYETFTSYPDGSTKMHGVKVTTVRAGARTFVISGKQAEVGPNETNISLVGDVRLTSSDGMDARTERATYTEADAMVRAPGPVEFSRGRLVGSGVGLRYAKNVELLTILDRAIVHLAPGDREARRADISARSAEFSRADHVIRFSGAVKVVRGGETIEADSAVARLSADDQRFETVELRGRARMVTVDAGVGGLRTMRGRNIDLQYRPNGETLEQARVIGEAVAEVAGQPGTSDRIIAANTLDVSLASDGSTPTAMQARGNVRLAIPAERGAPTRSIQAQTLDGRGEAERGLTRASFAGGVQFHESGREVDRSARSATLDVTLAPGLSEIEEARFAQSVRFEEGTLRAAAALARYLLADGILELTGTEPALATPQVVNERIAVYAARIDVTLSGPTVKATGAVKSELRPPPTKEAGRTSGRTLPSMFDKDQLVAATSGELLYDGRAGKATYAGAAQLWQADTSIKANTIVVNESNGDLAAHGSVVTTTALEEDGKDGRKVRRQSTASSKDFLYEETPRRATYLGDSHMNGPQGDLTAAKIELYLKESGDELERAEAYEAVTLRDENRETKGTRLTYFAADNRYVMTGAPLVIKDECGRETTGKRVTFDKATETIVVDGSNQTRTQTRGGASCP